MAGGGSWDQVAGGEGAGGGSQEASLLPVRGSPQFQVHNDCCVLVSDIGPGVVGKAVSFYIYTSQTKKGTLEVIVSVADREVPVCIQSEGNAKFKVIFKPQDALVHLIIVKYNGLAVHNSPFQCEIIDNQKQVVGGAGLKMCPVGLPANNTLAISSSDWSDYCLIKVHSPGGEVLPLNRLPSTATNMEVEFTPVEVGAHRVHIGLDGQPVIGSPFTCNTYDVGRVVVTGMEGSLIVGKAVSFTVDASQAGEGTLEVEVTTAKSTVQAEVVDKSRGIYEVTFVPQETIRHFANIYYNDDGVPSNPFQCFVGLDAGAVEAAPSPRSEEARAATNRGDVLDVKAQGRARLNRVRAARKMVVKEVVHEQISFNVKHEDVSINEMKKKLSFKCSICGKILEKKHKMKEHISRGHTEEPGSYKHFKTTVEKGTTKYCDECPKVCKEGIPFSSTKLQCMVMEQRKMLKL